MNLPETMEEMTEKQRLAVIKQARAYEELSSHPIWMSLCVATVFECFARAHDRMPLSTAEIGEWLTAYRGSLNPFTVLTLDQIKEAVDDANTDLTAAPTRAPIH